MDGEWITLALFLFFFIILPLLQGLRRRGEQQELPEAEEEWQPEEERATARRGRVEPEEWADWDEPAEVESRPAAERSAWEELGLDDLFRSRETAPRPGPEPAPPPKPQPSPRWEEETPSPRWEPEPARQPRVELPPPAAPLPVPRPPRPEISIRGPQPIERPQIQRRAEVQPPRRKLLAPADVPRRPAAAQRALQDLRGTTEIRRAIVLAEILGAPRSLQEHETRQ